MKYVKMLGTPNFLNHSAHGQGCKTHLADYWASFFFEIGQTFTGILKSSLKMNSKLIGYMWLRDPVEY